MGELLTTPSGGQSEVLETLHYQGAIASGIPLYRLGTMVSNRWLGDEDTAESDPVFEADLVTVLVALQAADAVVAHDDLTGAVVDLGAGPPPGTTRIVLTGQGRVAARHARPRPHRIAG